MNRGGRRRQRLALSVVALLLLGACTGHGGGSGTDDALNAYPANYKSDIVAAMHAYLNDPSGIRDAAVSEPMLKSVGGRNRYVVCLRLNSRQPNGVYTGIKEIAAIFLAGRFDQFTETAREVCTGATYAAFPELEKLPR